MTEGQTLPRLRGTLQGRRLLTLLLLLAFLWSFIAVAWSSDPLHAGGIRSLLDTATSLLAPELSPSFLAVALAASWQTVAFAVTGLSVAVALGLPMGIVASGLVVRSPRLRRPLVVSVRFVLAGQRSIHELVWAWFFVVAIGLSPMAAILALGINYGGILGRIYAELLADVPEAPLRALRAAGASERKVFLYGRLPMALPDMVSYTFYRLECGVRSAAIMSFVGIAGLGYQVDLALQDLRFGEVSTLLLCLVLLIAVIDAWSSAVRRRLVA